MRLRRGKSRPRGSHASGISEIAAPPSATICSSSGALSRRVDALVTAGQDGDRAGRERRPMGAGVDAAREARDDDVAGVAEIAGESLGEGRARPRRRCASRRSPPSGGSEPRPTPRTASKGGAVSIACSALRIVRLAERDEADRRDATPPRSRARPPRGWRACRAGRAGRRGPAAPRERRAAPPKRLTRARNVRGPMFSERISRSQSSRCSSLRRSAHRSPSARSGLRSRPQAVGCSRGASTREARRGRRTARPSDARRSHHSTAGVAALAISADERRVARRPPQPRARSPAKASAASGLERRAGSRGRWRRPCRP